MKVTFASTAIALSSLASQTVASVRQQREGHIVRLRRAENTNSTLQLLPDYPAAQACFSSFEGNENDASYNAVECAAVKAGYEKDVFWASKVGGYQMPNWGNCQKTAQNCELDYSDVFGSDATDGQTCHQGSVPTFYVDAKSAEDLQAAVKYSVENDSTLAVKSSGHSFQGYSSGPGKLGLWTHNMQGTEYMETYTPPGCEAESAVMSVLPGTPFSAVYQAAHAEGKVFPGGASNTVSPSGGYITGGGHSAFSPKYGLSVDALVAADVVLANGTMVTATRCQHPDLFFAIAGGGGNAFGIIAKTYFRVYEEQPVQVLYAAWSAHDSNQTYNFLDLLLEQAKPLVEKKWGGYAFVNPVEGNQNAVIFVNSDVSHEQGAEDLKELRDFISEVSLFDTMINLYTESPNYFTAFNAFIAGPLSKFQAEPSGLSFSIASRLIADTAFEDDSIEATKQYFHQALETVTPTGEDVEDPVYGAPMQFLFTAPYKLAATGGTSETPAWRNTIAHVAVTSAWLYDASAEKIAKAYKTSGKARSFLEQASPNTGMSPLIACRSESTA